MNKAWNITCSCCGRLHKEVYDGFICVCGKVFREELKDDKAHLSVPSSDRVSKPFPVPDAESIPFWIAEKAYEGYVKLYGNTQSLERIRERGGFYKDEIIRLIRAC